MNARKRILSMLLAAAMAVGIFAAAPMTAYAAVPAFTTPSGALAGGMVGVPYEINVSVDQQVLVAETQVSSGTLPNGLSVFTASSGTTNSITISGTPTAAGTFTFALTVTNENDETSAPEAYSITIAEDASITVGFGGKEWYVIAGGGNGLTAAPASGALTLLAKNQGYGMTAFHDSSSKYNGSTLQTSIADAAVALPAAEQALILLRTLTGEGEIYNGEMAGENAADQAFWPISKSEHAALTDIERMFGGRYWLRSPGGNSDHAFSVSSDGGASPGLHVVGNNAIRPAFHFNLASVLFTSAATGGKSGAVGPDLAAAQPPANFYKFTVVNTSLLGTLASAAATANGEAGDTISIDYTHVAGTEPPGTISAIITDTSDNVLYYGKLASYAANGTVSMTIPAGLAGGSYKIKLFAEQINGDNETDFASAVAEVSLTVNGQPTTPGDRTFLPRTLTDKPTGVRVSGSGIANTSRLTVSGGTGSTGLHALHPAGASCAACDEIRRLAAAGEVIVLYNISLTYGYSGPVDVYIPFSGTNGSFHTVLHCNRGVLEERTGWYANGGVTTTWARLSPFAVLKGHGVSIPDDLVVEPPKTGDASHTWAGVLMIFAAVALFTIAWLYLKRQRKEGR